MLGRDEARLYRLIWQRALASQMKEKELETTTAELSAGVYEPAGQRHEDRLRWLQPGLHRGPGRRRGGARAGAAAAGRGRRDDGRRSHADAALHRAAAALHRGDADQGARGARHRPAVDLCRHDLDDRRPRLRHGRGAATPPGADRRGRHRPAGRSFRGIRRPRLHRPDGGGARRDRSRRPRPGCRSCASSTARSRSWSTRSASELRRRDFTTEPTDEVCSLGHPMVIRLGRNGQFLACSLYPEHKESRPLPGEEPETPDLPGVGEVCPKCGGTDGGTLVAKRGRFGPFVGCSRYPECDYIKKDGPPPPDPLAVRGGLPEVQGGPTDHAPGAPDRLAVLGLLALPEMRLHDVPRAAGRDARRRRGPGGPQGRRRRMCLVCGATMDLPAEDDRPRWTPPGGWTGESRRARATGRAAAVAGRAPAPADRARGAPARPRSTDPATTRAGDAADRTTGRSRGGAGPAPDGVTGGRRPSTRSSAASPPVTRPRTRGARIATAVGAYLAWLDERGIDWRTPGQARRFARTSRCSATAMPGRRSRQRLGAIRSFYRFATRDGLAPATRGARSRRRGSPGGCPGPRGRAGRADAGDDRRRGRCGGGRRHRAPELTTALALRDRALVETAYAAGLRISELAVGDARFARSATRRDAGRSARAARNGSACSAVRPGRPSTAYLDRRPAGAPRAAATTPSAGSGRPTRPPRSS